MWGHKRPQIAQAMWRKKNKAWGIMLHNFKLNYKVTDAKLFDTGTKPDTD